MTDFALDDECNDLVIVDNEPVLVSGVDRVARHVKTVLETGQGEWFLDLEHGTPWFARILGHKFSAGQTNITVRDAILSIDGVASIRSVASVKGSTPRSAIVTVVVLTTQGAEVIVKTEI